MIVNQDGYREKIVLKKRKIGEWHPVVKDNDLRWYLELDYKHDIARGSWLYFTTEDYAGQCDTCGERKSFPRCRDCGAGQYLLQTTDGATIRAEGITLVCVQCEAPIFHNWTCTCGRENVLAPENFVTQLHKKCFIATVASESEWSPDVVVLSQFRDEVLLRRIWGRRFVSRYYVLAPAVADAASKNVLLKRLLQVLVVSPAASAARIYLRRRR